MGAVARELKSPYVKSHLEWCSSYNKLALIAVERARLFGIRIAV